MVAAGYFPPGVEVGEIVEEVGEHVNGGEGGTVVYGDFNCRMDNGGERGKRLREAMGDMGLVMVNKEGEVTYHGGGGASQIDLVFVRGVGAVEVNLVEGEVLRKHIPLRVRVREREGRGGRGREGGVRKVADGEKLGTRLREWRGRVEGGRWLRVIREEIEKGRGGGGGEEERCGSTRSVGR